MKILVDADAVPVKNIIINIAKKNKLDVIMYIDTSHVYDSEYAKVITIDKGRDAVDFAIVKDTGNGDIVITNDYPLAALSLLKGAICIDFNGMLYTENNIDLLLSQRQINQKIRKQGKRGANIKKRTVLDDEKFESVLNLYVKRKNNT